MRRLALVLALGACAPTLEPAAPVEPIPFQLDASGVQLLGSQQRIDFGRTDHSAIPAMTKLVGQAPAQQVRCREGGEIVVWPDGTGLIMKRGAFRGWVSAARGTGAGATCDPARQT